jgi:hypothetical protein
LVVPTLGDGRLEFDGDLSRKQQVGVEVAGEPRQGDRQQTGSNRRLEGPEETRRNREE